MRPAQPARPHNNKEAKSMEAGVEAKAKKAGEADHRRTAVDDAHVHGPCRAGRAPPRGPANQGRRAAKPCDTSDGKLDVSAARPSQLLDPCCCSAPVQCVFPGPRWRGFRNGGRERAVAKAWAWSCACAGGICADRLDLYWARRWLRWRFFIRYQSLLPT
ncbi:uncharacterized protein K452DRAFT_65852 [Aplosporella prunicola CBS 121167]|uniref:Uncharacterized protein n=1 Tax=Aplosporella prunicola CBS 121167 TaxID=1176127 RepID=A0A6A6BT86_9PEZI|nr:uncharacterized protein K452DRAFT_65852 [Aplosporella prunicola CBS 121167]KAF2146454.1 hypothetical protein K452DRAFT_65852 [Aplosporella prunicola CBS 121167]